MEEESLETKKSAVLGQQYPRREAIHVKATTLITRKVCMLYMDHSLGIPQTLFLFILTSGELTIKSGFLVS